MLCRMATMCSARDCSTAFQPKVGRGRPRVFCSHECKEREANARKRDAAAERRVGRVCRLCGGPVPESRGGKAQFCSSEHSLRFFNAKKVTARRAPIIAARPPCPQCGDPLPAERRTDAIYCSRTCMSLAVRARNYDSDAARDYNQRYHYGTSSAEFDEQLAAQGGMCAVCGLAPWVDDPARTSRPHRDHDHETGRKRGILCPSCNLGLGKFGDDVARLRAAIAYLERWS
jgi:hypothetical protein